MNLRTMAFAAVALTAFGTGAVSFAQTAPGPQGTPPPPPVPVPSSSVLISTSPEPTSAPSGAGVPVTTPTPPAMPATTPTPEPFGSPSAAPTATATPGGRGKHGKRDTGEPTPGPSPTDTPEPPQFSTLDGVWEVQMQPLTGARTLYSHLYVTQNGNALTGTWRKDGKTALPFTGTFDGRLFKLTVTNGPATEQLSGYEENYSDMVGLYTTGDAKAPGTPFTAAHRKRERDKTIIR